MNKIIFLVFNLQNLTVQHNSLQFSHFNNIAFQFSPGLTLSILFFTLSSHHNFGRSSGLFPCGPSSSTESILCHACSTHISCLVIMSTIIIGL